MSQYDPLAGVTLIRVHQDGEDFDATVESGDRVSTPDGEMIRLTVLRHDNGVKAYVFPERQGTVVSQMQEAPTEGEMALSHLAPPHVQPEPFAHPGQPEPERLGSPPPVGASVAGVPIAAPDIPIEVPEADRAVIAGMESPYRFMVKPTRGRPNVFHTRDGCPRVPSEADTMGVDEQAIDFFNLKICQVCERRDSQISWQEVLEETISAGINTFSAHGLTEAVISALEGRGFTVSPEVVDRT